MRRGSSVMTVLALALIPPAWAADPPATIDDLVGLARDLNPDLQVAALEADAAAARIDGAGSLPDPKVQAQIMDWPRNARGYVPASPFAGTTKKLYVSQQLPFWGKRDLKREIAEAGARKAMALRRQVETDLVARIKVAYAEYHAARLVAGQARGLRARMETLAQVATARYAGTQGRQADVTRARVETASLEAEITRTEADRQRARVRLNRLLGRAPDAALAEASEPRPLPPEERLALEQLTARAEARNPDLLAQQAAIDGANHGVALAERTWMPDVEVTVGAVRSQGDWSGYEAMVSASLPLQWGLHESEIGEAKATAGAARVKRDVLAQDIGSALNEAWIGLKSAREVEKLLRDSQVPQAEIGFDAAARAYQLGRAELIDVLTAEQQLWKSEIDLIKVRFEQQIRLAEIEKLVGGEL